jgi:hypothetical protein
VKEFPGFSVEDDGDITLPLANGLLVNEELPEPVCGRRFESRMIWAV